MSGSQENQKDKKISFKIVPKRDIKSPTTKQAIKNLEYKSSHLIQKKYTDFQKDEQNIDTEEEWIAVLEERDRIIDEDKRKKMRQSQTLEAHQKDETSREKEGLINKEEDKGLKLSMSPRMNGDKKRQIKKNQNNSMNIVVYNSVDYNTSPNKGSTEDLNSPKINQKNFNKYQEQRMNKIIDIRIQNIQKSEEKRKKLLTKLQVKLDQSEKNRSQLMNEEVFKIKLEERSRLEYEKQLKQMKEQELLREEQEKEYRKNQHYKIKEEFKIKEYQEQVKQSVDQEEQSHQILLLEDIAKRQDRSRVRFIENMRHKTTSLKVKNTNYSDRLQEMQELWIEKEMKQTEKILKDLNQKQKMVQEKQSYYGNTDYDFIAKKRDIMNKSVQSVSGTNSGYLFDKELMKNIERRFELANERKSDAFRIREKQFSIKREAESLKNEEISELKWRQQKQQRLIKLQIYEKEREKEKHVKSIKESLEIRAREAVYSQMKMNIQKIKKLRESQIFL